MKLIDLRRTVMRTALIVFASLMGSISAASAGLYTVSDVPVDVTAESAAKAREQALAQGQADALTILLKRFTLQQDWPRLPAPDSVRLDPLISGFAVSDEHTSTTRYLAKVTYDFVPEEVRRLLRANNLPFTEVRSKPVLVLPVLAAPDGSYLLFEPQNIWAAAWRTQPLAEQLVPMLVPTGDLDDVNDLQGFSAPAAQWPAVQAIAAKYEASAVVIPILALRKTASGVTGDVQVRELKPEGGSDSRQVFQGADETYTMSDAIAALSSSIQEAWKAANAVVDTAASSLDADVRFSGLQQWLTVRRGLEQMPNVRAMRVIGFSVDGARVNLSFVGSPDQLMTALAQRDISLRQEAPGYWVIEPLAAHPAPTPSVAPVPAPGATDGPANDKL